MERRVAFIYVGVSSLLLLGGLVGFVLWAHQRNGQEIPRVHYAVYFNQAVNGLILGSSVRYLGVEAGQVEGISLDTRVMPPRVRVVVGLKEDIPITQGDVATLKPTGITGVSYVDLRHDQPTINPIGLTREDKLPVIRSELSEFDRLLNDGSESARHLNTALQRVEKLLNDDNLTHITETLNSLDRATHSLDTIFAGLRKDGFDRNASLTLRDGRQAIDNISELSQSLRDNPSRLIYPPTQDGVEIQP